MRKVKHVKIGEYVLVSKYSDHDIEDPGYVGYIREYGVDETGPYYRVHGSNRYWRNVFRISLIEGIERIQWAQMIG